MPYLGRELTSGNYLKLDDITSQFDGSTVTFQLKKANNVVSILSGEGSKINVQDVLLIFVKSLLHNFDTCKNHNLFHHHLLWQ